VYLTLLLGSGSVAQAGGPLTWLPLWRLPAAGAGWAAVGVITLLPPLSVAAWLAARVASRSWRELTPGWRGVAWPFVGLAAWALVVTLLPCARGACPTADLLRLGLLLLTLFWLYLYVVNERPDLYWIVVAAILMQSTVAIGQFISQSDLGLAIWGELALDPQVSGVSVVMRGPVRWLRGYGLTRHPNILAANLTSLLLLLIVVGRGAARRRRQLGGLVFLVGYAALLATLSRWAIVCLMIGLGINALPLADRMLRQRRLTQSVAALTAAGGLILTLLFLTIYGDAVTGRVVALETPVENRSLWERNRDTSISLKVIAAQPIVGAGLGNYVAAAREYDEWAEIVHNAPLLLAAEMGLVGLALWLWLVIAPLARPGAWRALALQTALWLSLWLPGLFYPAPHPFYELRSALLVGLIAGVIAQTQAPPAAPR
jgi:hypothetical protein